MFKELKKKKGQSLAIQHAIMFFLVVAVIMTMAAYFRRVIQARMRDTRLFVAQEVKAEFESDDYLGVGYFSYEPYYINQVARRAMTSNITKRQSPTLGEHSRLEYDQTSDVGSWTNQLAPKYAD